MTITPGTLQKAFDQYRVVDSFNRVDNLLTPVGALDPELYGLNLNFKGVGTVRHFGTVGALNIPTGNIEPLKTKLASGGAPSDFVDKHIAGILNPTVCQVLQKSNELHGSSYELILGEDRYAPAGQGGAGTSAGLVTISSVSRSAILARQSAISSLPKRSSPYTLPDPSFLTGRVLPSLFDVGDRAALGISMEEWVGNALDSVTTPMSGWNDPLDITSPTLTYAKNFLSSLELTPGYGSTSLLGFMPSSVVPVANTEEGLNSSGDKIGVMIDNSLVWNSHYEAIASRMAVKFPLWHSSGATKFDTSLIALEELAYIERYNCKQSGRKAPTVHAYGEGYYTCPLFDMTERSGFYAQHMFDRINCGSVMVILPPVPVGASGLVWVSPVVEVNGTAALDGVSVLDLSSWSLATSTTTTLEPCPTNVVGLTDKMRLGNAMNTGRTHGDPATLRPMDNCLTPISVSYLSNPHVQPFLPFGMRSAAARSVSSGYNCFINAIPADQLVDDRVYADDTTYLFDFRAGGNSEAKLTFGAASDFGYQRVRRKGNGATPTYVYSKRRGMGSALYVTGLNAYRGGISQTTVSPRLSPHLLKSTDIGDIVTLKDEWDLLTPVGFRYSNYSAVSGLVSATPVISMFTLPRIEGQMILYCDDVVIDRSRYDDGSGYTITSVSVIAVEGSVSLPGLIALMGSSGADVRATDASLNEKLNEAETYSDENATSRVRFSWRNKGFGLDFTDSFLHTKMYKDMFTGKAAPAKLSDDLLPASDSRAAVTFKQALNRANAPKNKAAQMYAMIDDSTIYHTGKDGADPLLGTPSSLTLELVAGVRTISTSKGDVGSGVIWVKPINSVDATLNLDMLGELYGTTSVPATDGDWAYLLDLNHDNLTTTLGQYLAGGYSLSMAPTTAFPTLSSGVSVFLNQLWSGVSSIGDLLSTFPELALVNTEFNPEDNDLNPTQLIGEHWYPAFEGLELDRARRLHYMLKGVDMSDVERLVAQYMFYAV